MLMTRPLGALALLFALAPLACQSHDPGPRQIEIPPRLDPYATLESSQAPAETSPAKQNAAGREASPATTPGRAYSSAAGSAPSYAPSDAFGFSSALVPRSAHDDPEGARFVKRGKTYEAKIGSGKTAFTWVIDSAPTSYLDLVAIEDGGARVRPLHNGEAPGAGKSPTVDKVENRGGSLVFVYADKITQTFTPLGRSLRVELTRDPSPRRGRLQLDLGGVLGEKGVDSTRVFRVPYFDIASVAALDLKRNGVRFLTAWFDFHESHASLVQGKYPGEVGPDGELRYAQHARYLNATGGMRQPIHERFWITWGTELDEVLPSMDRAAAPERAVLGDYYYISYNTTPFAEAVKELDQLAGLGVKDAQIWMHQWQKLGYDQGYPNQVMPPRREWGGLEGLKAVRAATAAAGFGFSLHHNWMFNTLGLPGLGLIGGDGLTQGGTRESATDGYLRPSAALELVDEVEGEIHEAFQTRGTFTDSLTAALPAPDFDRKREGWGLISKSLDDLAKVLARLRVIHGAPLAGEGSLGFGNVTWSGLADVLPGSLFLKAQPAALDRSGHYTEIVPHFALGPLHELSVRAGVGPPARFTMPEDPFAAKGFTAAQRDQTQTLSALYGNAGYHWWYQLTLPGSCARDWWSSSALLVELARPGRTVLGIHYVDDRGRELELAEWIAAGHGLSEGEVRLHVTWEGGDELWANLTAEAWSPKGRDQNIAPFGFLGEVAGVEASILSTPAGVVQSLASPTRRYVDGRGATVTAHGITTDGAVGLERTPESEGGGWQVFPIPKYTLSMPGPGRLNTIDCNVIGLDASLFGEGELDLIWLDARGVEAASETRPHADLQLTLSDFQTRGATSVRISSAL